LQTTNVGDLFEDAVVRRVDPVIGLTLELPTSPKPSAGFAHISNVSDDRVEKLEKKFRPSQKVRARVVGHWGLEGLTTVSLKPSVVEQKLLTYDDVIPGMEVRGTVVSVEDWGARLQLSDSIRAICPLAHMSEVALSKPSPKFQVGFCSLSISGCYESVGRGFGLVMVVPLLFASLTGGVARLIEFLHYVKSCAVLNLKA
jgi:rRNA biogenesis protein RRP5